MAEETREGFEVDLLPVRQRIAWMAAIWTLSVAMMVAVTVLVRALFA